MTSRENIEIDYCPTCRGVWLDRGELDKLIERSTTDNPIHTSRPIPSQQYMANDSYTHEPRKKHHDTHQSYDNHHKRKRKESFLGDIFDF